MVSRAVCYHSPVLWNTSDTPHTWYVWYIDLKWEVARPNDVPKCQKTSKKGRGTYDSPGTQPIASAPPNPVSFRHIPSTLVHSEFGRCGRPVERSKGGTSRRGELKLLTRDSWALQHIWDSTSIICRPRERGSMPWFTHRACYNVKKKSEGVGGIWHTRDLSHRPSNPKPSRISSYTISPRLQWVWEAWGTWKVVNQEVQAGVGYWTCSPESGESSSTPGVPET